MKVIFLDFDGVITIPPKWYLQADLIKNVKKIVKIYKKQKILLLKEKEGVQEILCFIG